MCEAEHKLERAEEVIAKLRIALWHARGYMDMAQVEAGKAYNGVTWSEARSMADDALRAADAMD